MIQQGLRFKLGSRRVLDLAAMPYQDLHNPWGETMRSARSPEDMTGFEDFLHALVSNPDAHARWLNTVSLLEHIGSRKILKSQDSRGLSTMMLEHIAEEARHAAFFRRLSQKVMPGRCDSYADDCLLAGTAARCYFQSLDRAAAAKIAPSTDGQRGTMSNYLLVTTLIEERAERVYPVYQKVTAARGLQLSLKSVIAEEEKHLAEMAEMITQNEPRTLGWLADLRQVETRLFAQFAARLSEALFNQESCKALETLVTPVA
jgi:rubrerythrin